MVHLHVGKFGDILSLLPAYWKLAEWNGPGTVLTGRRWGCIFDRVSYVKTVQVPHDSLERVRENYRWGRERFGVVTVCQGGMDNAYSGPTWEHGLCIHAGVPHLRRCGPVVLDRRVPAKEEEYLRTLPVEGEGAVIYNLTAETSPFRDWGIAEALEKTGRAIDLNRYRADNFVDMIGLYERAALLVTVDTGTLHLARAVPSLPVAHFYPPTYGRTDRLDQSILYSPYQAAASHTTWLLNWLRKTWRER